MNEGEILNLNRSLRTPPLILIEDVSLIEKSRLDGILSSTYLLNIVNSTIREKDLDLITSLESFSLVHSVSCMSLPDGFYSIKPLSFISKETNTSLEKKRNLHSIFLDTDGLDMSILDDKEIDMNSENSLHTSLQPLSKILNELEKNPLLYNGKSVLFCFLKPNLEIIEFEGLKPGVKLSEEQKKRHIKFNSLIIGRRSNEQKKFVCRTDPVNSNPKTYFRNNLSQESWNNFFNKQIDEMGENMSVTYGFDDLIRVTDSLNCENKNVSFSSYFAKDNRSRPNPRNFPNDLQYKEAKAAWWAQQKSTMKELLIARTKSEIIKLFTGESIYLPIEFEIKNSTIRTKIVNKNKTKLDKMNIALERVLAA